MDGLYTGQCGNLKMTADGWRQIKRIHTVELHLYKILGSFKYCMVTEIRSWFSWRGYMEGEEEVVIKRWWETLS